MKSKYTLLSISFLSLTAIIYYALTNPILQKEKPTQSIEELFAAGLANSLPDRPNARAEWELNRLKSPISGTIPSDMRGREQGFLKQLKAKQAAKTQKSSVEDLEWVARGPFNISGRTRAFAMDVTDENILFAGSVSGGLWRSTDQGLTWTQIDIGNAPPNVSCIIQDPREGQEHVWYFGTGEGAGQSPSDGGAFYTGNGLYKSQDNGMTWQSVESTASESPQVFEDYWDITWRIVVNPMNGDILVATFGGIYRSTDGGATWRSEIGHNVGNAPDAEIAMTTTGVAYATLHQNDGDRGIWRSEDGDNWTRITPANFPTNYSRIAIGINPSNENEVYFLAADTDGFGHQGFNFRNDAEWSSLWKYTYISGNGTGIGAQWEDRSANLPIGPHPFDDFISQNGYDLYVRVKPDDPNVVFIGGTNIYRSNDAFTSPDNTTFVAGYKEDTELPLFELYKGHHPDQHEMFFLPSNPNIAFTGSDGGLHRTDDVMAETVVWNSLNNGYLATQFYTVAFPRHNTSPILIGGLQDNGTHFTPSADPEYPWKISFNYDGSFCAIPDNEDVYYMATNGGMIVKLTVDEVGNMTSYSRIDPIGADRDNYLFINPFTMDLANNDILYMPEGSFLWRNDALSSLPLFDPSLNVFFPTNVGWTKFSDDLVDENLIITALATSTENPAHRLYIGTNQRNVYRLDDANTGNPAMVNITGANFPNAAGYASCIAVDPRDADKVFVVFSNYEIYSLYYSINGGTSWTTVAGNLEENNNGSGSGPSLRWLSILPVDGQADSTAYFLGTSVGLFHTSEINGVATQWDFVEGVGNVVIEMVESRELDNMVAVATHGNGMFTANTPKGGVNIEETPFEALANLQTYPNPTSDFLTIQFELQQSALTKLAIYDLAGKKLQTVVNETLQLGKHQQRVEVGDLPAGMYVCRLKVGGEMVSKTFVVK
ncbi:MAG: T9SS type A sorting domain-containing protein [Chitinophagales bacterium]